MTIRQLPDFAFRSASDYAAAMGDIHARYDPTFGVGVVDVLERLSVFHIFKSVWFSAGLTILVVSIVVCTLDRTPRLWRGVADIRVAQPDPYFDPRLPDRAEMTDVAADDVRAAMRRRGFRVRAATDDDGADVPLRRSPPVHEDGHAPDPHRARPVPRRRRGHVTTGRRAGSGGPRGRVAHRAVHRDARPPARQELRLRGARVRDRARRPTSRRIWPCTRTAARSRARPSGSTIRSRWPATRSTRTGSGPHRTWSSATPPASRCGTRRCR